LWTDIPLGVTQARLKNPKLSIQQPQITAMNFRKNNQGVRMEKNWGELGWIRI
jgi:hypothetical protein